MAKFLEQDEINNLVAIAEQQKLADSAKLKLRTIYISIYPAEFFKYEFDTLDNIGEYLSELSIAIDNTNEYYDDYTRLKDAYNTRI